MNPTSPPPFNPLIGPARKWTLEALEAWVASDSAKMVAFAPMAVEHLGKAFLWRENPVLLTPLSENHAASLLILATSADLSNPKLRTIALRETLNRASRLANETFPLNDERKQRLIECRGGAIHAGQFDSETALFVLADALTVIEWLRAEMGLDARNIYASHAEDAFTIIDGRRTRVQRAVDQQKAKALLRYTTLLQSIGDQQLIADTVAQKEALIGTVIPKMIERPTVRVAKVCPVCGRQAALLGDTRQGRESSSTPSAGVGDTDDAHYIHFPDSFYCHVCGLLLGSKEALEVAGLPTAPYEIPDPEITPELIRYVRDPEAWLMEDES